MAPGITPDGEERSSEDKAPAEATDVQGESPANGGASVAGERFTGAAAVLASDGRLDEARALQEVTDAERSAAPAQDPSVLQTLVWGGREVSPPPAAELSFAAREDITIIKDIARRAVANGELYVVDPGASGGPKAVAQLNDAVRDEMKKHGLHGFLIPEQYGGREHGFDAQLKLFEELSRHGGFHVVALTSGSTVIGPVAPVLSKGTEEQKQRILVPSAKGADGFFALTQSNAGVNVSGMKAMAVPTEDGGFELFAEMQPGADPNDDNRKWYITGADRGNTGIVVVKNRETGKRQMFLLTVPEKDSETFQLHQYPLSAFSTIPNNGFTLSGYKVTQDDLIAGDGMKALFANLNNGRAALGAMYSGLADYLIAQSAAWIDHRNTLGNKPLRDAASNTDYRLGLMTALSVGLKAVTEFTAGSIRSGKDTALEAIVTKWFAGWAGRELQDHVQEIFGGRTFEQNHPVGRFAGDLLVVRTFEGPNTPLAGKLFGDLTEDHVAATFEKLAPILDKRGLKKLSLLSPQAAAVIFETLQEPAGRKLAAFTVSEELGRVRRGVGRALGLGVSDYPPELRRSARFAKDTLKDYPRWVSVEMRKHGKELLDDIPTVDRLAQRAIMATVMHATAEYAKGKDATTVRAARLMCDIVQDEISGKCPDYVARSRRGRKVGRDVLAGQYSGSADVRVAPGLFSDSSSYPA